MNGKPSVDAETQVILQGLTTLVGLLEKPVARDALDVLRDAETSRQNDILRRLHRSLKQYTERRGDLFYVGLLGHFSAGKSSTINSLLNSWSTVHERSVGLHPTDTAITLITKQENSSSLLGVIRETSVPIRFEANQSPLLDNLVLVDTPGTGDPHLIEEIARDFLPICDVVLFLFSAANPLDRTDTPLLEELHKRLQFIPVHFVITRADELRVDSSKEISDSNIDTARVAAFLSEIILRVNRLLAPTVYGEENFILIDNKKTARYNVNKLRDYLTSQCDTSNHRIRIEMHAHKVQFYRSSAKELRSFFARFLDRKLAELNKIVAAAQRNIERYNQNVLISNSNLTKMWMDQHLAIREVRQKISERLRSVPPLPASCAAFEVVSGKRISSLNELNREATYIARNVSSRARSEVSGVLQGYLHAALKRVRESTLTALSSNSHGITTVNIHDRLTAPRLISSAMITKESAILRATEEFALGAAVSDLRKLLEGIERLLSNGVPLKEYAPVIESAQKSLINDLSQFFQNVELYRGGVFSHTTKDSISTLGIGGKLDELESEFTDADKSQFSIDAVADLFPGFAEMEASTLTRLSASATTIERLCEGLPTSGPAKPEDVRYAIDAASDREESTVWSDIVRNAQSDIDRSCDQAASTLARLIGASKVDFEVEIEKAQKERRHRYGFAIFASGTATLLAYLAYRFLRGPLPEAAYVAIGLGVIAHLIGDVIGFVIAKIFDKFPETTRQIHERFANLLDGNVRAAVDSQLDNLRLPAIDEAQLSSRLTAVYERLLQIDPDGWNERAMEYLLRLRPVHEECIELRRSYQALIDETAQSCANYFSDAERNLRALTAVAARIKQIAIEPSFDLLNSTQKQLESVKQEIESVEFS